MGKGIGYEHRTVSTNTTIMTTAGRYYGGVVVSKTTGAVTALVYDAKATAQGDLIDCIYVTGGANLPAARVWGGISLNSGLFVAVTCTSASDNVIIFYGGI